MREKTPLMLEVKVMHRSKVARELCLHVRKYPSDVILLEVVALTCCVEHHHVFALVCEHKEAIALLVSATIPQLLSKIAETTIVAMSCSACLLRSSKLPFHVHALLF